MKVCDMCGKKISRYNRSGALCGRSTDIGDFCPQCYDKLKKFIKFELAQSNKNKHR